MVRPDFVSSEDIARWSEVIDTDELIPAFFKQAALLREIHYAGLWLVEELQKLSCEDHKIVQIQFTHGFESFGNNPWEIAQELLAAYKDNTLVFEEDFDPLGD